MPLYYIKKASEAEWVTEMFFLSTGTNQVSHAAWDDIAQGMVATPLAYWAKINVALGQLCSQVPCDYETVQTLKAFTDRAEAVSGQILH